MKLKRNKEIKGCIHIHSTYSDGTEPIPTIAKMANELGLDYIIMTDHMTLKPLKEGFEGWYDDVAVVIGYEINDSDDTNHYLALGLSEEVDKHLPALKYVKAVKDAGGIGIIAHPDECRDQFVEHPPYPWTAWETDDYDGIEIWNHLSEWIEGLTPFNKFRRFIHPRKSIVGPPQETLKRWDEINKKRPVFSIGGVDAHAHIYKLFGFIPLRVFHYKVQFKTIRTHLLLQDSLEKNAPFESTKQKILQAIKNGHAFIENFLLGDASGFRFWAEYNDQILEMGNTEYGSGNITLNVVLPEIAEIRLIKNGVQVHKATTKEYSHSEQAPGIFRIEVVKDGKNWVYSNHIRVYNQKRNHEE